MSGFLGFIILLFICSIPYLICGIFAFFIMLPTRTKRKRIPYNQLKKQNILNEEEEKRIKDKWINDLKNGKRVNIGDSTIKFKNQVLIINGISFAINEIHKLELTHKVLNVSKDYINILGDIVMRDFKITVEQYKNEIALEKPYGIVRCGYKYKFNKQYYISIIFYNGNNKLFPIAYCANCNTEGLNAPYEESLILELNNYINSLKIQEHL